MIFLYHLNIELMASDSSAELVLSMQTAPTRESCRRLLIQCVVVRCTAASVRAKSVNTGDNIEACEGFTRPVIFNLSNIKVSE